MLYWQREGGERTMTDTESGVQYIRAGEAMKLLHISNKRMSELMKNGTFTVYENDVDRRVKLLSREQVDAYARRMRQVRPKSSTSTANSAA